MENQELIKKLKKNSVHFNREEIFMIIALLTETHLLKIPGYNKERADDEAITMFIEVLSAAGTEVVEQAREKIKTLVS